MAAAFPLDLDVLQRVLDYLNDAVYMTDLNRRIVLWNRRAEEITGYRREDVVGRQCRESLLRHETPDGVRLCDSGRCPLHLAMSTQSASNTPELVYAYTADDRRIPVSVSVAPLYDDNGNVVGGIEVFRDESRLVYDLELARSIQQHMLAAERPSFTSLSVEARCYTYALVGGDFYEVRQLASETAGIFVADVNGHGVSSSLYTMTLKSLSESLYDRAGDPAAFINAVNRSLARVSVADFFATAAYVVVDGGSGRLRYVNAAHPRPLVISPGGEVRELTGGGIPLGVMEDERYEEQQGALERGEALLLYTDGVTELPGPAGRLLGVEGLVDMVSRLDWSRDGVVDVLAAGLADYAGGARWNDDVVLVVCRRL